VGLLSNGQAIEPTGILLFLNNIFPDKSHADDRSDYFWANLAIIISFIRIFAP
jgi:hypothetical protein